MKLQTIIKELGLTGTNVDPFIPIKAINTLGDASKNELSFLDNKKYIKDLAHTQATAVLVHPDLADNVPENCIALVCEEPYVALARASKLFAPKLLETKGKEPHVGKDSIIQETVSIGFNVVIGDNCTLMAGTVLGDNVEIGHNTIIYPNVTIYRDCVVGDDCIIHAGTVIGSDGFGFAISKKGEYIKIYQNGNVVIGNNVEIGSNCTIDRAAFSSTIIEQQCRIDNLTHIAHNCHLNKACILVAQVGLSGSTVLGEHVVMGGQAGTIGHLSIAPYSTFSARSGVTKTVKKSGHYAGYPILEHRQWLKIKAKMLRMIKS